ncbi:uncharacterized protein LOC112348127 [Selaginella moellendorffii]|uniref:uncharacterized protein LOC112348127 n=1 Tax=Selaginella moellendorffii TaxID=88036 RepID=UPI000D1C3461|nr:uncharacterized protein LOC112348127 [Selaginella moellendorffii]|eukprot:XP_024535966.1 uncharacterized protein LOC112348127 [Selaginella moellendorffii]
MDRGPSGANEIVAILQRARRLISEGNPGLALQAVVTALRISAGEAEIVPALRRAHEEYLSQAKAAAVASDLSALFAEACAIVEEASQKSHNSSDQAATTSTPTLAPTAAGMDFAMTENGSSSSSSQDHHSHATPDLVPILAESGRMQVVVDASADGSSFVCRDCGGLVSSARRDEHFAFWCSSLEPGSKRFGSGSNDHNDENENYMHC